MMLQPLPVSEDPHKQDPNLRRPHCPNIVKNSHETSLTGLEKSTATQTEPHWDVQELQ